MIRTLSIVMPAYNEGPTIHRILDKVRAVELPNGIQKELIVVNDCSKDNTEEAILNYQSTHPDLPIQYLKHAVNQGKGAALHTGIAAATGDYIVIQDADLEYDPEEYKLLLAPVWRAMPTWSTVPGSWAAMHTASCSFGTPSATKC